jgi:pyruvate formate lyase activating enzyme
LNAGKLAPVLRTLQVLKEEGVWLEITNLIIPSWTDDMKTIRNMCKWLVANNLDENPLHFSRFSPLHKLTQLPSTPLLTLQKARETALDEGIKYVYIGNVPGANCEDTICPKCSKNVVERKGFRVIQNHIVNGKCKFCGQKIAGVWT